MKKHQYVGIACIIAGLTVALLPESGQPSSKEPGPDTERDSSKIVLLPKLEELELEPITEDPPAQVGHLEILLDRALREAEVAAQESMFHLMEELLDPVRGNGSSFAERLGGLSTSTKAVFEDEEAFREHVAQRFYDELMKDAQLEENLEAIIAEFLYELERISQRVALESGLDVPEWPEVTLSGDDFVGILREEIHQTIGGTSSLMQAQARQRAAIGLVSCGVGLVMPTPLLIDLAIGYVLDAAIQAAVDAFQDPDGALAIEVQRSANELAQRICFGSAEHVGFYAVLLDFARFHNDRLSRLMASRAGVERFYFDTPTTLAEGCISALKKKSEVKQKPALKVGEINGRVLANAADLEWFGDLYLQVQANYSVNFGLPYTFTERSFRIEKDYVSGGLVVVANRPVLISDPAVDTGNVKVESRSKSGIRTWGKIGDLKDAARDELSGLARANAMQRCATPDVLQATRAVLRDFVLDMVEQLYSTEVKNALVANTTVVFEDELEDGSLKLRIQPPSPAEFSVRNLMVGEWPVSN
jgi:hypothetical protein